MELLKLLQELIKAIRLPLSPYIQIAGSCFGGLIMLIVGATKLVSGITGFIKALEELHVTVKKYKKK